MRTPRPFWTFANGITALLVIVQLIATAIAHREHKVHNIVLYPDKHSWCTTLPIKQVISFTGYQSEEIDNNVCVGACFSYSIPHTEPSDPGEVIVPYCDSCQPSETRWHHVTLEAIKDGDQDGVGLTQLVKRVQLIQNCSCTTCEKSQQSTRSNHVPTASAAGASSSSSSSASAMPSSMLSSFASPSHNGAIDGESGNASGAGDTLADDDDQLNMVVSHSDVPDLLNILAIRNETHPLVTSEHAAQVKTMLNHKIVALLQSIQEKNNQYDKRQLMELLRMIQTPDNRTHKEIDRTIVDFVESLNAEHIELDVPRLKEVLTKLQHSKLALEKHHGGGSGHKYLGVMESAGGGSVAAGLDLGLQHVEHVERGAAAIHLHSDDGDERDNGDEQLNGSVEGHAAHHTPPHHPHGGHHHVGEAMGHGHLAAGPHGSLVIQPDRHDRHSLKPNDHHHEHKAKHGGDTKLQATDSEIDTADDERDVLGEHDATGVREKLNVNTHDLKPNHAGTMLSYSSHVSPANGDLSP